MDDPSPRRLARFGRDRFVFAAGHRYHLVEAGRGPALLLLPGTLETYRTWNEVLPRLARRFRCLAVDLLGQGDSDQPLDGRYDVPAQADQMVALLDALEIERAHLMGVSLGGSIVLNLCGRLGDRAIRAVSVAGLCAGADGSGGREPLAWLAGRPVLGRVTERIARTGVLGYPLARQKAGARWSRLGWSDRFRLGADARQMLRPVRREVLAAVLEAHRQSTGLEAAAREIGVPVLHLCGEQAQGRARFEATWEVLRTVPQVTLIEVVGVGDSPQLERPAWFAESAAPWLLSGRLPRGRLAARTPSGVRRLTLR